MNPDNSMQAEYEDTEGRISYDSTGTKCPRIANPYRQKQISDRQGLGFERKGGSDDFMGPRFRFWGHEKVRNQTRVMVVHDECVTRP